MKDQDLEPVEYCSECLSLRILEEEGMVFCDRCGCTDISVSSIFDWEKKYEKKYHRRYIDKKL